MTGLAETTPRPSEALFWFSDIELDIYAHVLIIQTVPVRTRIKTVAVTWPLVVVAERKFLGLEIINRPPISY